VAVIHDYFRVMGGAERVAIEIARTFDAPVFTLYRNVGVEDIEFHEIAPSLKRFLLQKVPSSHMYFGPDIFEGLVLEDYDVVISSGNWSKFIVPSGRQLHVHYCHTPPRMLYDLYGETLNRLGFLRWAFARWARKMRVRDYVAAQRIDAIVANSKNVARRIEKYWGRKAERVIYPPVDVEFFAGARPWEEEGYFFTVSRLFPEKRVDVLVEVFRRLPDKKLIVAGTGPMLERLRKTSPPNVEFIGWIDDETKARLYKSAEAVVYIPRDEDFGLVPVEAQAAGTPVIGVREGGLVESVINGKTGVLLDAGSRPELVEKLTEVIDNFKKSDFQNEELLKNARRFDLKTFRDAIRGVVNGVELRH